MNDDALILQQPPAAGQLFLLFHGVGAEASDLAPLGRHLGQLFPQAWVVSVNAPDASDFGQGRQWFSVQGVTEASRPARVAATMPRFIATVQAWQQRSGVEPAATALVGFSQGAIMALEASGAQPGLAGRIVAIAGRFATLPAQASPDTTLHLLHGKADPVIPYGHTVQAAEHLIALGGDVTADVLPSVGHEITADTLAVLTQRLTSYIPKRLWDQAMQAAGSMPPPPPGVH